MPKFYQKKQKNVKKLLSKIDATFNV